MICEALEDVERYIVSEGKEGTGRLIINIPPGHGKTLHASVLFPAWFMGRNPDKKVILASYGASLSEKASRDVRNLMESQEYQKVFGRMAIRANVPNPVEVDPEGRSVQSWEIHKRLGGLTAAGVGGPLIGRRTNLFVIDDPHKDRDEAESDTMRQNVWEWYTSVALTRLQKGGAVVIIMQRWHEDDLVGRLLERHPEEWKTIVLPAIADENDPMKRRPGEVLAPDMFDMNWLMQYKNVAPPRDWFSMYQQVPTAADGDVFRKEWFQYSDLPDKNDISYGIQIWDCAMTEKEENDWSACATLYVTRDGVHVADIYRGHLSFPDLKARMFDQYNQWNRFFRISRIGIENRVAGTSVLQSLKKESNLPIIPLEPESKLGKSKLQRAQSVSGYVQAGRVTFRKGASWLSDFEHELLAFPRGKHDDMVDAFVYGLISVQGGGRTPRKRFNNEFPGSQDNMNRLEALAGGYGMW